jgi:hypothetical protein
MLVSTHIDINYVLINYRNWIHINAYVVCTRSLPCIADDYGSACEKLLHALETSNLESATEDAEPGRKRRKIRRDHSSQGHPSTIQSVFADQSSSSSEEDVPTLPVNTGLPPPPQSFLQELKGKLSYRFSYT